MRRWRLLARVAETIATSSHDFLALANTTAELIAQEIGDGCAVILLDLNGQPEPVIGVAHRDPAMKQELIDFGRTMTADDYRAWVSDFATLTARTSVGLPATETGYAKRLREHELEIGIEHVAYAPIRYPWGGVRGIVDSIRYVGSEPFSDYDLSALAAAADALGLGLELLTTRARERSINRLWGTAFEVSPIGHAMLNLDGRILTINAAGAEIVGRALHQATGLHWRAITTGEDFEEDKADIERMLGGEQGILRMRVIKRPDETMRWISRSISVVRDDAGNPEVIHVQFADISPLYESQQRAALFERLLESSPDYIGIANIDGRLRYLNRGGRTLVGLPDDIDVTETRMNDYHDEQARPVSLPVEEWPTMRDGIVGGESTIRDWRDGSSIPVSVSSFVMRDDLTQQPIAIATIQRDIRERRSAQRAIADLAEQRRNLLIELVSAEQAERTRIANDVHDDSIQLLAASQLRLQLVAGHLHRGDLDAAAKAVEDVSELVSSAQRHLREILLDLEPPNSPGRQLHEALADTAASFFADTDTDVNVEGSLTDITPDVAALFYRTGRESLSNARQHAAAKRVTATLDEDADLWRLVVQDDGVGLPDPLPVQPGHLGVRGMASRAAALGGSCVLDSNPGGGTRVTLEVPRTAGR